MCGIAGILSKSPSLQSHVIENMTAALKHRGPDAQGIFINQDHTVALGHRRLSILDLSESANQPMYSADGRYVIVFNGEIYNFKSIRANLVSEGHSFLTNSDTEVLITAFYAWGINMLDRLNGMFAFAIYDQLEKNLWLFRDRMGKKPLYYYVDSEIFVFASEIKSILTHQVDRSVNTNALHQFLHLGYIPEPETAWSRIFKFPSGSYAIVNPDLQISFRSYWTLNNLRVDSVAQDPIEELKGLLTNSISERLISDVPLGTFLSGGTDSSLITAIASQLTTERLKTFSIGFSDQKFNESKYARLVAEKLKTDHHEYIVTNKDALELTEEYIQQFDEPFADTSAIPTMLVSKMARREVTVVLTGDGGDELFLGYGAYDWARRLSNPALKIFKPFVRNFLANAPSGRYKRASHLFESLSPGQQRSHVFSQEQYFFTSAQLANKLLLDPSGYRPFHYFDDKVSLSEAEKQAIFDTQFYLKDDLLVKVDRASMRFGLECRCPLLDHRIVEFAMSLPIRFKKREGIKKWILKELLGEHLPKELVHRPKWGFSVPLATWLKGELKYLIDEYLEDQMIDEVGLFQPGYINELKTRFFSGKEDYLYNRLWVILLVHKWIRQNE